MIDENVLETICHTVDKKITKPYNLISFVHVISIGD